MEKRSMAKVCRARVNHRFSPDACGAKNIITAADLATGAFTLAAGSKDAALIVTLPPGA